MFLMILLVSIGESRDWVKGNLEYIRGIQNTGYILNNELMAKANDTYSAEITHSFSVLPNAKFSIYNDTNNLKIIDTTIFYSMLERYGFFEAGWNFKSLVLNGKKEEFSNAFLRYKTREIKKTTISYTYNYMPSKVMEHVVDLNYRLIRGAPFMIGFQYKKSEYKLKQGELSLDGLFIKAGFTF